MLLLRVSAAAGKTLPANLPQPRPALQPAFVGHPLVECMDIAVFGIEGNGVVEQSLEAERRDQLDAVIGVQTRANRRFKLGPKADGILAVEVGHPPAAQVHAGLIFTDHGCGNHCCSRVSSIRSRSASAR
ncbi:Uncharacterised protein [Serratia plymuthica]|nr:Uncharacterised protein [Serratia plymuthica]